MANGNNRNSDRRSSSSSSNSSDGKLKDGALVGWLIGFLFAAIVIGGVFRALQNNLGLFIEEEIGIVAIVSADGEINVFDEPDGQILGSQDHGSQGEVIDGPAEIGRTNWWYVDFEEDPDGWVSENSLILEVPTLKVGDTVEMIRTAGVWDQVGGGISGGLQFVGALGELVRGPELFNDEKWWNVDFYDDPDGWVRESDIMLVRGGLYRLWQRLMDKILLPSLIISVLLFTTAVVLSLRVGRLLKILKEKYQTPKTSAFVKSASERAQGNERWDRVQELVFSQEPGNWRLAILEADVMLTDIVRRMGYSGDNLGEQLKQVEKSDFLTLDKAWEAHKVRNSIAHEGGDFILTQREARRIVDLYAEVFKEFHYI